MHFHLYASPSYLDALRRAEALEDLDNHRIVTFGEPVPAHLRDLNWLETPAATPTARAEPVLQINDILSIKSAVRRGAGIAMLPDYMFEEDSGLVQVLPETEVPSLRHLFLLSGRDEELRPSSTSSAIS